jgi:hypothetical protein
MTDREPNMWDTIARFGEEVRPQFLILPRGFMTLTTTRYVVGKAALAYPI